MGVPVVTLSGVVHAGRVGTSLLTHLGRPEWVAKDADEYVAIATRLAEAGVRTQPQREALREQLRTSALCDNVAYAQSLEAAYFSILAKAQCGAAT